MRSLTSELVLVGLITASPGPVSAEPWAAEPADLCDPDPYSAGLPVISNVPYEQTWVRESQSPTRTTAELNGEHEERTPYGEGALARLQDQVEALRGEVAELRAALLWDEPVVALDPWQEWINAHPQEIAKYPDEHIAIHPQRGIVHHDPDGRAFAAWCRALSEEELEEYLITTSSMYL